MVNSNLVAKQVKCAALFALKEELSLTPKPGLVDKVDSGSHQDLSFELMAASAEVLGDIFQEIALVSFDRLPSQSLREEIAEIGRRGEEYMFTVTNGINTHKGAIWALGLMSAAYASGKGNYSAREILKVAGEIASFEDSNYSEKIITNGQSVINKHRVPGARGEAMAGFPTIKNYGLVTYEKYEKLGCEKSDVYSFTLLSLMMHLDDTCLLHRGGKQGLEFAKEKARDILAFEDISLLGQMNEDFIALNLSPGGSADLLAGTIFIKKLEN